MIRCAIAAAFLTAFGGCRIAALDLTGKACPCPEADGWTCQQSTQTCVRGSQDDALPEDSTDDSGESSADLTSNLSYWYPLNETSGQAVHDSSPNNVPAWLYNPSYVMWTTGKKGGGLHFVGSTPYQSFVIYPSTSGSCLAPAPTTGSITVAGWVSFDSFGSWSNNSLSDCVVVHGSLSGTGASWGLGATDGCGTSTAAMMIAIDTQTRVTRCGATTLQTGTWYFLTGVYNASAQTLDIYVNGVLDSGELTSNSPAVPSSRFALSGSCPFFGTNAQQTKLLHGDIDEMRFYERALTSEEVAALYTASSP